MDTAHSLAHRSKSPLALIIIGVGLLSLGVAALLLLPKAEAAVATEEPSAIPVEVEFAAPELELKDLDGNPVALADYRGQIVLVNNWATWCPPCKAEMPTLNAYYEEHQNDGFTLIAIEAGEPAQDVAAFAEAYGLSFVVWPDPREMSLSLFKTYSLPSSFVIDREGTVRLAWTGAISRAMLERYVTPLLED